MQEREDWQNGGFGLYVHWPFCAAKCPYCDFNSHVVRHVDQVAWRDALVAEITRYAAMTPGRTLTSIFFGGGTPSLMPPETVDAVISAARRGWGFANSIEIALEANPSSVELGKFKDFASAGVNRVSLGFQALNDADLRRLGRLHSVSEIYQAWDVATTAFDRASFDLIYARQFQDEAHWRAELTEALALQPSHMSLYQLTIEDGTAFGDRYRIGKLPGLPTDDIGADLYQATQELCVAAGLPAYEVSNHAKTGEESLHNQVYWRYGDYVGVGPGAHGRITLHGQRWATEAERAPTRWLQSVRDGSANHDSKTALTPAEMGSEYLMMSLRLSEGSNLDRWRRLSGAEINENAMTALQEQGFIWVDGSQFGTTDSGRPLLNSVLRALLSD
ncbi:radical SAM family heme chaperone HemW [Pararhodobacter oceanensis]|uniref:Heme chaperone HemW n=1 Tax=Pararhodobacter oceanensis TaxID=2172121 RepID=A0A2T8HSW5_9RHOB|nr:radical SAM family heme chaperone HemW [Pararhodobacter oceanensis]PVH28529.1 coproporphyrinogen III oxidase [Pararhodobacter oceanensis]